MFGTSARPMQKSSQPSTLFQSPPSKMQQKIDSTKRSPRKTSAALASLKAPLNREPYRCSLSSILNPERTQQSSTSAYAHKSFASSARKSI